MADYLQNTKNSSSMAARPGAPWRADHAPLASLGTESSESTDKLIAAAFLAATADSADTFADSSYAAAIRLAAAISGQRSGGPAGVGGRAVLISGGDGGGGQPAHGPRVQRMQGSSDSAVVDDAAFSTDLAEASKID